MTRSRQEGSHAGLLYIVASNSTEHDFSSDNTHFCIAKRRGSIIPVISKSKLLVSCSTLSLDENIQTWNLIATYE
jgi:hypothetical protein